MPNPLQCSCAVGAVSSMQLRGVVVRARRAPRMRGWTEAAYRLEYLTSESLADVEMGRTGVTEDALLIIGEVTTNALLRTPHPGGCGAFVVLVFFCPYCLWGSVRCAGVEQTHAPHLCATRPTFDCEGGWGLVPGSS